MNVFFDFEFTGLHQATTPISLGMVSQEGQTFYAEFTDYDESQVDEWIEENVIRNLLGAAGLLGAQPPDTRYVLGDRAHVAQAALLWLQKWDSVSMWGDVLAYDWALFCELFGGARHIPKHVFYIPFDIATLLWAKGEDPDLDRVAYAGLRDVPMSRHNALRDAWVIKKCYEELAQHV